MAAFQGPCTLDQQWVELLVIENGEKVEERLPFACNGLFFGQRRRDRAHYPQDHLPKAKVKLIVIAACDQEDLVDELALSHLHRKFSVEVQIANEPQQFSQKAQFEIIERLMGRREVTRLIRCLLLQMLLEVLKEMSLQNLYNVVILLQPLFNAVAAVSSHIAQRPDGLAKDFDSQATLLC
eukprot:CAMPEP_0185575340 /NCGR_PEP_ID=MMETSP0434-20130131/6559_1 /TAXON_ID=626734 ORGANISM="Favella taraikaensis, Strain Fe Narragansett Bay" /NCGR_SAMPLE_ID=MMETSP0434 /ASSEMBLY_ACC=CAM_ASM_000379 /LENGTH=180 /DNA_ID=CAMNT_0028192191 /DNA_START=852 /DNA_END=1394 /DNA_ORIENTATION=+